MQIICMILLIEKKYVLTEKHALACPNPDTQSDTKNMQTVISNVD